MTHWGGGNEDFIAVVLLLLSNVSVTPGSTDVAAIFINNDEIICRVHTCQLHVHDCERVVILKISSSDVGALNYSVEVDLLQGTA